MIRIAVIAPSGAVDPENFAALDQAVAASAVAGKVQITVHPATRKASGHFAGTDAERLQSFLEVANSPDHDVIWALRGGYGSNRILGGLTAGLKKAAEGKTYLGFSDFGFVLAALHRQGFKRLAHAPMPVDALKKDGGAGAIDRVLRFVTGDLSGLDRAVTPGPVPRFAFNVTVLRSMLGTPWMPDMTGAELFLEDVGEYSYALDRSMWQLAESGLFRRVAGVRLGRFTAEMANVRPFGTSQPDLMAYWCVKGGARILGPADIAHDADNKIVPFGVWSGGWS